MTFSLAYANIDEEPSSSKTEGKEETRKLFAQFAKMNVMNWLLFALCFVHTVFNATRVSVGKVYPLNDRFGLLVNEFRIVKYWPILQPVRFEFGELNDERISCEFVLHLFTCRFDAESHFGGTNCDDIVMTILFIGQLTVSIRWRCCCLICAPTDGRIFGNGPINQRIVNERFQ